MSKDYWAAWPDAVTDELKIFETESDARRYATEQQDIDHRDWYVGQRIASFNNYPEAAAFAEFEHGPMPGKALH